MVCKNKLLYHYAVLLFVVIVWGMSPLYTKYMYNYYSASINSVFTNSVSALALLVINRKKLKLIDKSLIQTAGITGLILGVANLSQKIGFQYTSPSNYAFLENLSVVTVPLFVMIVYRKRPSATKLCACVMCLCGCAVLCGLFNGFTLKIGDLLCALAGALYGVNIAVMGERVKKFPSSLFVMVQLAVVAFISLLTALTLNFVTVNGVPPEPIRFPFRPEFLLMTVAVTLTASTLCWVLRANALKVVDSTVVAAIMPMSAVITSVLSVCIGQERFSVELLIGAALILAATVISALSDAFESKRAIKNAV